MRLKPERGDKFVNADSEIDIVDEIDGVEPQGMYPEDKTTDKKLYVAILRVCKQAYTEASSILYERNLFRYEYRHLCVELGGKALFPGWVPPKGRFERIQHVSTRLHL